MEPYLVPYLGSAREIDLGLMLAVMRVKQTASVMEIVLG